MTSIYDWGKNLKKKNIIAILNQSNLRYLKVILLLKRYINKIMVINTKFRFSINVPDIKDIGMK